jgi:hypothetical protein
MAPCFDTSRVSFSIGSRLFLPSTTEVVLIWTGDCRTTFHPPDKGPWPRDTGLYSQTGRVASLLFSFTLFSFGCCKRRPQGCEI